MKNNKGFMMAEVVVVSAIILVTLTTLYVSYNKIISLYNQRVDYYDVRTLYDLEEYRNTVNLERPNISKRTAEDSAENKTIYYSRKTSIDYILTNANHSSKFQDYIEFLSNKLEITEEFECILMMERCSKENPDECKYAYLEMECIYE